MLERADMFISDINECETNNGNCGVGYTCENNDGSFTCVGKTNRCKHIANIAS